MLAKLLASASQLQQQSHTDPTLHPALAQQFCQNPWQPHHQHLAAASLQQQQQQQQVQAQQQVMHSLPPPAHSTRSSAADSGARRWDEAGSGPSHGSTFMGGLPGLQQVHPWSSLPPAAAMASAAAAPTCAGMGEQGDKAGPHQAAAAAQVLGEDLGEALPLGFSDSPRVPVVISPTFSSQELNILLEVGGQAHLSDPASAAVAGLCSLPVKAMLCCACSAMLLVSIWPLLRGSSLLATAEDHVLGWMGQQSGVLQAGCSSCDAAAQGGTPLSSLADAEPYRFLP